MPENTGNTSAMINYRLGQTTYVQNHRSGNTSTLDLAYRIKSEQSWSDSVVSRCWWWNCPLCGKKWAILADSLTSCLVTGPESTLHNSSVNAAEQIKSPGEKKRGADFSDTCTIVLYLNHHHHHFHCSQGMHKNHTSMASVNGSPRIMSGVLMEDKAILVIVTLVVNIDI